VRRREFITLLGGAAAWPLAARAQVIHQRHVGMLVGFDDPEIKAFQHELERLGWLEGRNIHIDYRYAPAGAQVQALARELVTLQPEVIFAQSRPVTAALQQETKTIPIVFTFVTDPIGAGFIGSLRHPGNNITGFEIWEPSIVGKWLQMLKEISPQILHVTFLGNPKTAVYYDYLFSAGEATAPSLGIQLIPARIENVIADIERAIATAARLSNGGMVVVPDSTTNIHRDLIVTLAARNRLPVVYPYRFFVESGGLMAYTVANEAQYRQAAAYVDQILRGAKPSDLPVQTPARYETFLNLKTAKELGLVVPTGLLIAADALIE
jgi:putative tryptophan/tyrosine transport system substrate-binding protein